MISAADWGEYAYPYYNEKVNFGGRGHKPQQLGEEGIEKETGLSEPLHPKTVIPTNGPVNIVRLASCQCQPGWTRETFHIYIYIHGHDNRVPFTTVNRKKPPLGEWQMGRGLDAIGSWMS